MSSEPFTVSELTQLIIELQQRVTALEQQARGGVVTVNYLASPAVSESSTPASTATGAAEAYRPHSVAPSSTISEAERRAIAEEVGAFFRRCLSGGHRGESGRARNPLASKVYVLVRDLRGNTFTPVRVFKTFASIRPFVKAGDISEDAIFAGFPTQWEAQAAVRAAGLSWPVDD